MALKTGSSAAILCRLVDTTIQPDCRVCCELATNSKMTGLVKLRDMLSAANSACRSCLVICLALDHFNYLKDLVDVAEVYVGKSGCIHIPRVFASLDFYLQPDEDKLSLGDLALFNFKPFLDCTSMPWAAFKISPSIDRNPWSAVTFAKIHAWLSICVKEHPKCSGTAPLPKRVIDVGEPDGRDPCRLYETRREVADYIALSHCWGPSELIYKSTTKTLEDNKLGVPWEKLSRTFQEAIVMTRELGVRYLWIDSLCIIQDNAEDWNIEGANMGNIYKNAYVTIAATASSCGADGLFTERNRDVLDIPLPGSTELKTTILKVRQGIRHSFHFSDPLSYRAWAYQERLLSRRILHFSSEELIWECRTEQACECGRLDIHYSSNSRASFERLVSGNDRDRNKVSWEFLLNTYSMLQLTHQQDRLPALSGIASQLFPEPDYLAGLRRPYLLSDLCWKVRGHGQGLAPRQSGAPSWSWASINAPIQCGYFGKSALSFSKPLEVVEASCTAEGENPFGRLSDGYLILRGVVLEATWFPLATKKDDGSIEFLDFPLLIKLQADFDGIEAHFDLDCTDVEEFSSSPQPVSLLISYYFTDLDGRAKAFMLVLRELDRGGELVYERIGAARIRDKPTNFFDSANTSTIKII